MQEYEINQLKEKNKLLDSNNRLLEQKLNKKNKEIQFLKKQLKECSQKIEKLSKQQSESQIFFDF